jgi:hypothetical protein
LLFFAGLHMLNRVVLYRVINSVSLRIFVGILLCL